MHSKKAKIGTAILLAVIFISIVYAGSVKAHTYTLSNTNTAKCKEIQPLYGRIKVSGTSDTSVTFTDIKNGKTFTIGYISPRIAETITLTKGRWYQVSGTGDLTLKPVKVRIP